MTEARFRARLRELPDGTWTHRGYIEYDNIYPIIVSVTKHDDSLVIDFTETADQAPAVINCTRPACVGATIAAVLPYLCFDMPWSPAGLQRAIEVQTREGSVVARRLARGRLEGDDDRQLHVDDQHQRVPGQDARRQRAAPRTVHGHLDGRPLRRGRVRRSTSAASSSARRSWTRWPADRAPARHADGLDAGGFLDSPSAIIANVEDYEYSYPFLYLYRRIQPDTGGAGMFRGGATLSMAYVAARREELPTKIMHAIGTQQPGAVGIAGGYPSCTNQFVIKRDTNIRELLDRACSRASSTRSTASSRSSRTASCSTSQRHATTSTAGRDGRRGLRRSAGPRARIGCCNDVIAGVVSLEHARERYGVDGRLRIGHRSIEPATRPATRARSVTSGDRRRAASTGHAGEGGAP